MKKIPFKILVVDDDAIYGKIVKHLLEEIDHEIILVFAKNGLEALEKVYSDKPNLIITDWDMPGISGIEFCRRLNKAPEFEHIPVIMCTGIRTTSVNLREAFDSGVVDFMRKPIDRIEFIARVNSMIKLSQSYQIIKSQKEELLEEKEKTERLLRSILPREIANDLTTFGKTEPKLYDNVTVFMSDIVDFTIAANKIDPHVLISELDEIIQSFDAIMEKNHCERIKTIGDAYVAVCGMPKPNKDHAEHIVNAAKDIISFLNQRNANYPIQWKVRIGIDTGQIIGGVVGSKKLIYDIFGDPINTASRVEATSKPMRIHLSQRTYNLVKNKFEFEEQPPIEVKGKGKMKMYFLKTD